MVQEQTIGEKQTIGEEIVEILQTQKPILVMWQLEGAIQLYEFPYHEGILKAHCGFVNSPLNTPIQSDAVKNLRLMVLNNESLDPTQPIDAEKYSYVVICGEYVLDN